MSIGLAIFLWWLLGACSIACITFVDYIRGNDLVVDVGTLIFAIIVSFAGGMATIRAFLYIIDTYRSKTLFVLKGRNKEGK